MKFAKVKTALQDILTNLTFAYVTTDKGVLRYDGENENDLAVGVSVQSYDTETETESPVEDGEYKLDDGRTLVIKSGVIEEIREIEENLEGEEPQEGEPSEGGDEPVDPTPDPEPEPTPEPETEEEEVVESGRTEVEAEEVENPTNEGEETDTEAVVKLREEVNELYKVVDELKARIEKLEGKPAAEPAANEFKNMIKKSGNDKLDNFISKYCK